MEKVLIVDDSALQAAHLKNILHDEYDITIAQTAEDGLRLAGIENFSLILLDVVMPGMDGFTLLKKIAGRDHHPECPGHFDYRPFRCSQ